MVPGPQSEPLSRSQRLLLAGVMASAAAYSGILWFTGGGAHDAFGAIAMAASALYLALYRVQSTASLLLDLQSDRKPPLLAVVLHLTALGFFIATIATWAK